MKQETSELNIPQIYGGNIDERTLHLRHISHQISQSGAQQGVNNLKKVYEDVLNVCVSGLSQTAHDLHHQLLLPVFDTNDDSSLFQPQQQSRRAQFGQLQKEKK